MILALDTATNFVGVALGNEQVIMASATRPASRQHAEVMVPTILAVLHDAGVEINQVSALAVGIGPGLFTGLRVGVTTAVVMAEALAVPLVAVSSLELVAAGWESPASKIVVVLDAKRGEVFHATFRHDQVSLIRSSVDAVTTPAALARELISESDPAHDDLVLLGDGTAAYPEIFSAIPSANFGGTEFWVPSVTALVKIAGQRIADGVVDSPRSVTPNYLRESDAVLTVDRIAAR